MTKPIDRELQKKLDNLVMAIVNFGHQVIHEQHSEEKSYVYGLSDPLVITRLEALSLLAELITADRKQLLDRVEALEEVYPEKGIGSIMPVRAVPLTALAKLRKEVGL